MRLGSSWGGSGRRPKGSAARGGRPHSAQGSTSKIRQRHGCTNTAGKRSCSMNSVHGAAPVGPWRDGGSGPPTSLLLVGQLHPCLHSVCLFLLLHLHVPSGAAAARWTAAIGPEARRAPSPAACPRTSAGRARRCRTLRRVLRGGRSFMHDFYLSFHVRCVCSSSPPAGSPRIWRLLSNLPPCCLANEVRGGGAS
jgi:hypothetical protein